jgi:hypothetical protein
MARLLEADVSERCDPEDAFFARILHLMEFKSAPVRHPSRRPDWSLAIPTPTAAPFMTIPD